ncbi:hypothetical protein evm_012151 [Chilo suppressalis]|nr:hypothetical protein evm_012151 [Chilo suppressalis]
MDLQKVQAVVSLILALTLKKRIRKGRWVKQWLLKREMYTHLNLLKEIQLTAEAEDYKNYFRMGEECFDELLRMVTPYITKQDTCMRKSITPEEKLAVTLRYLATGRNIEDLKFSAIMSPAAISEAIKVTGRALIYVLRDYMKMPTQAEEWKTIANDFGAMHQFWNCCGALDGKHVGIKKPAASGSMYYNYKGFYSIVLMALVNAKKEFIMIDVGTKGRVSDGGVLFYTKFWEMYQQDILNLPEPSALPNTRQTFPYVFVSDEAFALGPNLMKPYAQKALNENRHIFNYRLSRARSVFECAFGILNSKFGIFQKDIPFEPDTASLIVATCCYLHNYLRKNANSYCFSNEDDENKINRLEDLQRTHNRNPTCDAKCIRENFCYYFCNEGRI